MKELLSREGAPFTVRNVDEEDGAYEELIALGFRTVPVAMIGGRAVRGFDADAIKDALRAADRRED